MSEAGRRISKNVAKQLLGRVIESQKNSDIGLRAREAFKNNGSKDKKERESKDEKES